MAIKIYDSNNVGITQLYQWDIDRVIRLSGTEVANITDIHMTNKGQRNAVRLDVTVAQNGITVTIPNFLLRNTEPLVIYLYQEMGGTEERTVYEVDIPIVKRAMPVSYADSEAWSGANRVFDEISLDDYLLASEGNLKGRVTVQKVLDLVDLSGIQSEIEGKQDALIAGDNITIVDNVISATGGGGGGAEPAEQTPLVDSGDGVVGSSTRYAREDHVHPMITIDASPVVDSGNPVSSGGMYTIVDDIATAFTSVGTALDGKIGYTDEVTQYALTIVVDAVTCPVSKATVLAAVQTQRRVVFSATDGGTAVQYELARVDSSGLHLVAVVGDSISYIVLDDVSGGRSMAGTLTRYDIPAAATSSPSDLAASAAVGSSAKYAKEDHVHKMPSAADVGALASNTTYVSSVNGNSGAVTLSIPTNLPQSIGFGYSTTDTNGSTKIATLTNYAQVIHGFVAIKFDSAVPANCMLNINGTGAKPIKYRGEAVPDGLIKTGDVVLMAYRSTAYNIVAVDRAIKVTPSDATPQALGTAAAGSSDAYSRADHVHEKPTYTASDVGAAEAPKYTTLTLAVADWAASGNNYTCSKTVTGMTATSVVWLSYSDTEAEFVEAQSTDTLTFTVGSLPSAAITVNVAFMEGSALS